MSGLVRKRPAASSNLQVLARKKPAKSEQTLPTLLITGFLGAGKTTLVKSLLPNHSAVRGAILVCPFGESNEVDGTMLRLQSGIQPRPVFSLSGDESDDEADFNSVIADDIVPMREALDVFIIEASGMADPRPMLEAVGRMRGVEIESVVCVVDATHFDTNSAASCREVFLRQIASADVIVLSKTDLLKGEAAVDRVIQAILAARVAGCAAVPAILRSTSEGGITLNELRRALAEGGAAGLSVATGNRNAGAQRRRLRKEPLTPDEGSQALGAEGYASTVYCNSGRFNRQAFERWAASLPPAVLRAKGLLMFSDLRHPFEWQLLGDRSSEFKDLIYDSSGAVTKTSEVFRGVELVLIGRYGKGWEPLRFESGLDSCLVES